MTDADTAQVPQWKFVHNNRAKVQWRRHWVLGGDSIALFYD